MTNFLLRTKAWAVLLLLLTALPAAAQSRRSVQALQLWPELQAELALKNGDYLLLALRGQRDPSSDTDAAARKARFLGFDERRLTLGYEHFWNDRWSGGGTLRYVGSGQSYDALVPEVLLRHRSPLGPLTFGQRLAVQRNYAIARSAPAGTVAPASETWVRLRADVEKSFPMGSLALRPRLSYEAATHLRLQKAEDDPDERTIQFTSLRAEVGLRLNSSFDVTPWVAYQTTYNFVIEQTDGNGNILVPGGRHNTVTPLIGLDARLTLYQGRTVFERKQLPTQH